jgi:hypothetical protein
MPTGKLREARSLNHHAENEKLLQGFLRDIEIKGRSRHTVISYRESVSDFLDFTLDFERYHAAIPAAVDAPGKSYRYIRSE